jgi:sortase B
MDDKLYIGVKRVEKVFDKAVIVVCVLCFLICMYALIDTIHVYYHANDRSLLAFRPDWGDDSNKLGKLSKDCAAWVSVKDTKIDYPIMQGKDNSEYLNMDPYGEYFLSGSIFLDYRNNPNFTDQYSLVYGHHMEEGAMFGALDSYKKEDYFKKHQTGTLITKSNKKYKIKFYALLEDSATNTSIFSPTTTNVSSLENYIVKKAKIYIKDRLFINICGY